MNKLTIAALLTIGAATAFADTRSGRFVIETYSIYRPSDGNALPITFKLDSTSGNIWRFTGTDFAQIPVAETWSSGVDRGLKDDTPEEQRQRRALLKKMDDIVIPEIDFRQVNIRDAIKFIYEESVKYDADKRGVNLILKIGTPPVNPAKTDSNGFFSQPVSDTHAEPTVTFTASHITLHEAITIVSDIAGLKYRIDANSIRFVPYGCPLEELAYRIYDFSPSTVERIQSYQPELFATNLPPATTEEKWKQFFSDLGVTWPTRSSINPVPIIGKVVVYNSPQNLDSFENIIEAIATYPPRSGRFSLVSTDGVSPSALLLVDSDTGHTWQYDISEVDVDGKTVMSDSFLSIPARRRPPNTNLDHIPKVQ